MKFNYLHLHIVANKSPNLGNFEDFLPVKDGSIYSEADHIRVNQITELIQDQKDPNQYHREKQYSIVYRQSDFLKLDNSKLMVNIITLFHNNLPNEGINLILHYHYTTVDGIDLFDLDTATKVMDFDRFCKSLMDTGRMPIFNYLGLQDKDDIEEDRYLNDDSDDDDDEMDIFHKLGLTDDDEEDDSDENSEEEEDRSFDPFGFLEDPDMRKDKKKSSKKTSMDDFIGRSRVMKNAKTPKRDINRHGVIVANKRSDLEKDRDTIKRFLKVFLPGKKDWQKKFRKDVLKRWLTMYAISKKDLEKMEREHRRQRKEAAKKGYDAVHRGLSLTQRLMTTPVDRWNDPRL